MKKKVMGKPMKKAQKGGIISESGDLADALNEYEAMKKKGTGPKTDAEARKYMDGLNKRGKLGTPGLPKTTKTVPKKKMQMGGSAESNVFTIPSRNKISIPKKSATMMKKGGTMKKCKYGCK